MLERLQLSEPPGNPLEDYIVYIQALCQHITRGAPVLSEESAALTLNECNPCLISYRVPTELHTDDGNANPTVVQWSRAVGFLDQRLYGELERLLRDLNDNSYPL